ncbi:MAG: hypothetical protein ACI8S6_004574 [Myxococcota bacterium]|jgi:hypothetical protein
MPVTETVSVRPVVSSSGIVVEVPVEEKVPARSSEAQKQLLERYSPRQTRTSAQSAVVSQSSHPAAPSSSGSGSALLAA